jgi:EmrB/QacA subfamily drug resistance transporter
MPENSTTAPPPAVTGRAPAAVPAPAGHVTPAHRPGWTLAVVCVAVFMLLLDVTVVAVALADIQRDLGGGLDSLQWVVDAYTLTLAGLLLTAATLGDRIGRKRIFVAGLAVFTVASAGCAAAWSPLSLDLIRGVQGIGGALLFGTALPLLGAAFRTPAGHARAIGAFGASLTAASAVGPLVGGLLVDGAGWRWIFLVNLPIGLLALLATTQITESRATSARSADWPGTALLTAGLLALLLGLIRGNPDGWTSLRVLALLTAGTALLAGFGFAEGHGREPMLDLRLFTRARFTGIGIGSFAVSATLIAATTYLALFLQNGLGYTPLQTGLRVLPLTLAAFVAAPLTAAVMSRTPLWVLIGGGLALSGLGLVLTARVDGGADWMVFLPGFVVAGLGLGITGASMSGAALAAVPPDRAGMATGAVNTLRQVGVAAGVASLGALFQHDATRRATDLLAATPLPSPLRARLADAVGGGAGARIGDAVTGPLHAAVAQAGRTASADSLSGMLMLGGILALVAAVACGVLVARRPAGSEGEALADDAGQ